MSINPPVICLDCSDKEDGGGESAPASTSARKRLWNPAIAKSLTDKGKARVKEEVDKSGKMQVINLTRLSKVEMDKGIVKESCKELFFDTSDVFVRHHAEYICMNYQKKITRQTAPV